MEWWSVVLAGIAGSMLVAAGAIAVEWSRARAQLRERQLERRLDAFAEVIARAQALAVDLAEPSVHLAAKHPFRRPIWSARRVVLVITDLNRAMATAYLLCDAEGRALLDALGKAAVDGTNGVIRGDGTTQLDVRSQVEAFGDYATREVDRTLKRRGRRRALR